MSDSSDTEEGVPEERIAELEARIEELRRDVRPPRGPFGLPRPPTPGEVLRFVDEQALPTAIAALEANVRALEALREAIRLLRRVEDRDLGEQTGNLRERTDSLAREAIREFDRAVTDLGEAVEGGGLPDDERARSVLQEARAVREEVRSALENGAARSDGTEIDVEGELESIREEVHGEDAGDGGVADEGSDAGKTDGTNGG